MVKRYPPLDEGLNTFELPDESWESLVKLIHIADRRGLTAIVGSYICERRLRPPSEMSRYIDRIANGCRNLIDSFDPSQGNIPPEVFGAFIMARADFYPGPQLPNQLPEVDRRYRDHVDRLWEMLLWCEDAKKHLPRAKTGLSMRIEFLQNVDRFVYHERGKRLRSSKQNTHDRSFINMLFALAQDEATAAEISAAMFGALQKQRVKRAVTKKNGCKKIEVDLV